MSLTVAILCGGLGTRLRPLTDTMPKSLVPVVGKPFIDYQLELLANQGIERVVLCTGYLGMDIKGHVGTGKQYGLEIGYSHDGDQPLGTAGAIREALPLLGSVFGVLYGDVYPRYHVQAVLQMHKYASIMAVRKPGRGNVQYQEGRVLDYKRGAGFAYGDAGFSIFSAGVFTYDFAASDLSEIFSGLASCGNCLDGYEVTEPVYEVGSFAGLSDFERYVLHSRVPV